MRFSSAPEYRTLCVTLILFCRYEFVKRLYITNDLFSVENNCLTPTMKVRRRDVQKKYGAELDALYALGEPTWSSASAKL